MLLKVLPVFSIAVSSQEALSVLLGPQALFLGQSYQPLLKVLKVVVLALCVWVDQCEFWFKRHSSSHPQARPCKCWQIVTDVPGLYYEERREQCVQVSKQKHTQTQVDTASSSVWSSTLNLSKTAHIQWLCFGSKTSYWKLNKEHSGWNTIKSCLF